MKATFSIHCVLEKNVNFPLVHVFCKQFLSKLYVVYTNSLTEPITLNMSSLFSLFLFPRGTFNYLSVSFGICISK